MISKRIKDKRLRQQVSGSEIESKIRKFVVINLLNNPKICSKLKKKIYLYFLTKVKKFSSKTTLVRRCILTGRSRVAYRKLGISRIKLREMFRLGFFPGYKKAMW